MLDTDGDGLDNLGEQAAGTDPRSPDTDGDGLRDGDEAASGGDPKKADTDGDGIGRSAGLDPRESSDAADTDGDGPPDDEDVTVFDSDRTSRHERRRPGRVRDGRGSLMAARRTRSDGDASRTQETAGPFPRRDTTTIARTGTRSRRLQPALRTRTAAAADIARSPTEPTAGGRGFFRRRR
jgi:hypothetical protein